MRFQIQFGRVMPHVVEDNERLFVRDFGTLEYLRGQEEIPSMSV